MPERVNPHVTIGVGTDAPDALKGAIMLTPTTINGERAAGEPELITCTNRDAWRAAYQAEAE